ncbi:cell division protein FtsL [Rhodoferax sp.]|uniref:cell division protein FtsL n=1 Tax=Rhodoferax sp. TaxID=50421 RepID=UPI002842A092|nr:cell division protein FtsL [Rhodoferax sp.]MDR3371477.1 cell division protein FtsL [Rhodoferax sp.]
MMRLNMLLLVGVVLSALFLVNVQYQSRHLFSELDHARAEAHKLELESERLHVEKRAQATSARIESLAKSRLQMRPANPAITTYVTYTAETPGGSEAGAKPQNGGRVK